MAKAIKTLDEIVQQQVNLSIDGMETVGEALKILDSCNRRALGVIVEDKFTGIFSYADFIHRVVMQECHPHKTLVIDVATLDPFTVLPDCDIHEAFRIMSVRGHCHLPVLSMDKEFLGIVSPDDLRREIAKSVKETTEEAAYLRAYVSGESYYGACHDERNDKRAVKLDGSVLSVVS
jgi:predicted transcriptional regulator